MKKLPTLIFSFAWMLSIALFPPSSLGEAKYRIVIMPKLVGIIALGVPNVPGVARAVKEAGMAGRVAVIGNSTPDLMRSFLKEGTVKKVHLWNAPDHGYLTVYSAYRLLKDGVAPGQGFSAGRLGTFTPKKDAISMQVALPVMVFTRENVDNYHYWRARKKLDNGTFRHSGESRNPVVSIGIDSGIRR